MEVDELNVDSNLLPSGLSISSSIFNYRVENGRTYHRYKDGKYNIPNDLAEQERLDLQHNIFLLTFDDKLGFAPPCQKGAEVGRVLDVGTGTGIWAVDFGDEHPEAEVLGIDLSPCRTTSVPPNVDFEVGDIEDEWIFDDDFDYIHSRMMTSSIADWKDYLQRCYENLTPGGYLELQESDVMPSSDDGTIERSTSALTKYCVLLLEASVKLGRGYQDIPKLVDLMRDEIGFVDVEIKRYKWPVNAWPRDKRLQELGLWNGENLSAGLEAFAMAPFTRAHSWTRVEVETFLVDVRREARDQSIHAYWNIYSIVGRKPLRQDGDADPEPSSE
ncbi:Secondary metabolism regulator LAE1 [Colletotrichum higginsianum]|uniref:Secondary metabolism regulator LAE1 n=1 Tax=Colletotrichum higginsianum TaxID=80884 RepID=A0A4T0WC91_9PEZI|nr:Secondary metabolism regulator LAE1 [Colletotrichum higginsianum]